MTVGGATIEQVGPRRSRPEPAGGPGERDVQAVDLQRLVPEVLLEWSTDGPALWHEIDATLLFADISGFTKLSERLARLGRIGAEQLTGILNEVFGGMLGAARARQGSLLKFGGDALLLAFRGPDHAAQACAAAVEMRQSLRDTSRTAASAVGTLSLAMSVGIHTGPVHFFRAGSSHIELLVTGPAASTVAAMEKAASAGEILVSDTTREALHGRAPLRSLGPGHLLGWRRAGVEPPVHAVDRSGVAESPAVLPFVPAALRAHLAAGRPEPEHRVATVAFFRFTGVDRLMADEGPAVVASALDELVRTAQEAIEAEGVTLLGTDVDTDGGKLIAVAGVPSALEDDDGRILRAARAVLDARPRLAVQVGLHRGHVFVGEVGASFRSAYTVMGDTVNLAARVMSAAPPGRIYATPVVLAGSRTRFASAALEPFAVKGKSELVQSYDVGEALGAQDAAVTSELPFTGRSVELAMLDAALASALAGHGSVVGVVGDAGMGKSRIAAEALSAHPDLPVFEVVAELYEASRPYGALRDPVRRLLQLGPPSPGDPAALARRVGALAPALLPYLPLIGELVDVQVAPTAESEVIDPAFRKERVAELFEELARRALGGPAVIVLDDAQWLDEASTYVARRLADSAESNRWAVIVLRRPESGGFVPSGPSLELAPLSAADTEALVVAASGAAPLRPHEVDALVGRSGGHPLYVREIVDATRSEGSFEALPDSVDAVIGVRLDRLGPLPTKVLRYAAVLGRRFPIPVGQEILRHEGLDIDPATMARLGEYLAVDGDHYRFRHALLQEVAYGRLPYERRRELHLIAAEAIERLAGDEPERSADSLSLHFSEAQRFDKAWRYGIVAGDRARGASANSDAAVLYRRALAAARRLPEVSDETRAEVLTRLGDVQEQAGQFDAALDAYRRASRLVSQDPLSAAGLLLRRARARERAGAFPSALREIAVARRTLSALPGREARALEAQLQTMTALVRQAQGRFRDALVAAERAVETARASDERSALARAYTVLDWAHLMLGRADQAWRSSEALEIFEDLGDLNGQAAVMTTLGADEYFHGRWDGATSWYERARAVLHRAGNSWQAAGMGMNVGEILVNQGRYDEAEPLLAEASRVLRASGFPDGAAFADIQLARLVAGRGEPGEAATLLATAQADLERLGVAGTALEAAVHRSSCLVDAGDPTGALDVLDKAVAAAGADAAVLVAPVERVRASALLALGDTAEAEHHLKVGLDAAEAQFLPYEEAQLRALRARLASVRGRDGSDGGADATRAAELFEQLGVIARVVPAPPAPISGS